MARPDKASAVAELTDAFRDSSAAVLTEYRGLTVAQLKDLRRSLAGNATYAVVKNTLTKIAAREAGVETLEPMLEGPSAIAFVTGDPVQVAKSLRAFGREHPMLVVKGGVLDGRSISAEEIAKLADLESREVLLAKLAGAMKASLSQAVGLFAAPLSQAARLLAALEEQKKSESQPAEPAQETEPAPAAEPAAEAADAQPEAGSAAEPAAETESTSVSAPEPAQETDVAGDSESTSSDETS